MFIDLQKLDEIKYALTDLGVSVADLSSNNEDYFTRTLGFVEKFNTLMKEVVPESGINEMNNTVLGVNSHVNEISKMVDVLSTKYDGVDDLGKTLEDATQKFSKISSDLSNFTGEPKDDGLDRAKKSKADKKKKTSKLGRYAQKEMGGVKAKYGQLMGTLKIPRLGGIAGGMIGIMAYGVMDKQRVDAEFGQVADIMVNTVDRSASKLVSKATQWVSNFQEQLQKTYGIAKEEVQNVVKAFVEGGIAVKDWRAGFDKAGGVVGKNFASWSLGIDKLLNLGGGATASRMADYAAKYNMSLGETKDLLNEMMVIGQQDGVGRVQFIKNMEASGDAMESMGFKLEGVVGIAEIMQKRMGDLNLSEQFVGKYVSEGLKEAASAVSNMSDDWASFFGERMGLGVGVEAAINFQDGLLRASEGKGGKKETTDFFSNMGKAALEATSNTYEARHLLATGPGVGKKGANLIVRLTELVDKDEAGLTASEKKEKEEIVKDLKKETKEALETEAQKRTKWELGMNKWMKGLAKLGQGLFGMAIMALTKMTAYIVSAFPIVINMFGGSAGARRNQLLMKKLDAFKWGSDKNTEKMLEGLAMMRDSAKDVFKSIGGADLMKNLQSLKDLNPYSLGTPSLGTAGDNALFRAGASMALLFKTGPVNMTAPPTVQIVPMPVTTPGISDVPVSGFADTSESNDGGNYVEPWVGGRPMQIVSYGVTQMGDIQLALVGDCPKCGLSFDGGFDEDEYKSDLNSSKGTTVKSPNTKAAGRVNFDSKDAAKNIRDIGLTNSVKKKLKQQGRETPNLDPRLTGIVKDLSEAFPGKDIKIYKSVGAGEQAHGQGKALDVGVEGVPSADVHAYLASKGHGTEQGGLGSYPNQPFVHVDVMEGKPRKWTDYSGKGEPANYVAAASDSNKESGV